MTLVPNLISEKCFLSRPSRCCCYCCRWRCAESLTALISSLGVSMFEKEAESDIMWPLADDIKFASLPAGEMGPCGPPSSAASAIASSLAASFSLISATLSLKDCWLPRTHVAWSRLSRASCCSFRAFSLKEAEVLSEALLRPESSERNWGVPRGADVSRGCCLVSAAAASSLRLRCLRLSSILSICSKGFKPHKTSPMTPRYVRT